MPRPAAISTTPWALRHLALPISSTLIPASPRLPLRQPGGPPCAAACNSCLTPSASTHLSSKTSGSRTPSRQPPVSPSLVSTARRRPTSALTAATASSWPSDGNQIVHVEELHDSRYVEAFARLVKSIPDAADPSE